MDLGETVPGNPRWPVKVHLLLVPAEKVDQALAEAAKAVVHLVEVLFAHEVPAQEVLVLGSNIWRTSIQR